MYERQGFPCQNKNFFFFFFVLNISCGEVWKRRSRFPDKTVYIRSSKPTLANPTIHWSSHVMEKVYFVREWFNNMSTYMQSWLTWQHHTLVWYVYELRWIWQKDSSSITSTLGCSNHLATTIHRYLVMDALPVFGDNWATWNHLYTPPVNDIISGKYQRIYWFLNI